MYSTQGVCALLAICVGLVNSSSWDILAGRTKIIISDGGQPKCRCNADHTDERCDDSVCDNYCSQGDCNVSAEGQPECRCDYGYTGVRCDTSVCENYCLQGDCNVSAEGQPKCRCNAGYSGMRCDVSACHNYCLNNGNCSLNEQDEPLCQCTGKYEGERCETVSRQTLNQGFHWLPMVDGKLPPNALIGGFEDGNATYIARAYYSGSLCPGKYVNSTGIAYVPWGGIEHSKEQFEILCGINTKWVKTKYNDIPKNAFIGGRTGGSGEIIGEPLYICRDMIEGNLVCGKAYARTATCYLPYKGLEKEKSWYEILVED